MPLSKEEKESKLNELRAEYDILLPDESPFNPESTIAIFERKLERLKSQAMGHRPENEKEYDTLRESIRETEWRIAELRKPNWRNRSRSFAENTKMDVAQIVCDGLNRNVKDQDKRYKRYRESYGLSYVELAEVIGVHRKNITRLETPKSSPEGNATSTVDPFYLEALSLIYYENPYTLLGLKPALISPLCYEATTHADYIMNALMAYPDDQMDKYLQTFAKIAMLVKGQSDALWKVLDCVPAFTHLEEHKADIRHEQPFLQNSRPSRFPLDKRDTPEYKRAVLIQTVFYELKALKIKRPKELRKLASAVVAGEKILDILYSILILGGFPERKDWVQLSATAEEYDFILPHNIAPRRRAKEAASQADAEQAIPEK